MIPYKLSNVVDQWTHEVPDGEHVLLNGTCHQGMTVYFQGGTGVLLDYHPGLEVWLVDSPDPNDMPGKNCFWVVPLYGLYLDERDVPPIPQLSKHDLKVEARARGYVVTRAGSRDFVIVPNEEETHKKIPDRQPVIVRPLTADLVLSLPRIIRL